MMQDIVLKAGAAAFGDGEHPSTQGVLEMLQELSGLKRFSRILDMGTGSGLLAMVSASLWPESILLAVDAQKTSVETARQNIAENGLQLRIEVMQGNSYKSLPQGEQYDLVLCNIVADILLELSMHLPDRVAPHGVVILSGILAWRVDEVCQVHEQLGFSVIKKRQLDSEWYSVMLQKQ